MTPDGRYVAFASADPLLAPARSTTTTTCGTCSCSTRSHRSCSASTSAGDRPAPDGYVPGNGPTEWPTLSADGRYVSRAVVGDERRDASRAQRSTHTYVVDRFDEAVTRVSLRPDGTEPDRDTVRPSISADGSLVSFVSQAFNLAPNVYHRFPIAFMRPSTSTSPPRNSSSRAVPALRRRTTSPTQQHTKWWLDWNSTGSRGSTSRPSPMGVGSGTVSVGRTEANPDSDAQDRHDSDFREDGVLHAAAGTLADERVAGRSVRPPAARRSRSRARASSPGMRVVFDGPRRRSTQFVDSTTLVATTPAHAPGTVFVGVFAPAPDYRSPRGSTHRSATPIRRRRSSGTDSTTSRTRRGGSAPT